MAPLESAQFEIFLNFHLALTSAIFVRSAWKFQSFDFLSTFLKLIKWLFYLDTYILRIQLSFGSNFGKLRTIRSNRVWYYFVVHIFKVGLKFLSFDSQYTPFKPKKPLLICFTRSWVLVYITFAVCCGVRGSALASHTNVRGFEPQCGGRLSYLTCWQL